MIRSLVALSLSAVALAAWARPVDWEGAEAVAPGVKAVAFHGGVRVPRWCAPR